MLQRVLGDEVGGRAEAADGEFLTLYIFRLLDVGLRAQRIRHHILQPADDDNVFVPLHVRISGGCAADQADRTLASHQQLDGERAAADQQHAHIQTLLVEVAAVLGNPEAQHIRVGGRVGHGQYELVLRERFRIAAKNQTGDEWKDRTFSHETDFLAPKRYELPEANPLQVLLSIGASTHAKYDPTQPHQHLTEFAERVL